MIKFVQIDGEYINPQNVETVGRYGPGGKVGVKMRSGEILRPRDLSPEEVVALLEGRDGNTIT